MQTANLDLPLLQASQAQKHVTVNEALSLLDGLSRLRLVSTTLAVPPASPVDGEAFAVPAGASDAWAGQAGRLAIAANGGWRFVTPQIGWRAILSNGTQALWDGAGWRPGAVAVTSGGAASMMEIVEIDHTIVAGGANTTQAAIPASCVVFGVTGRVRSAITGSLTSWRLGVAGSAPRYGSGLGLAQGSFAMGLTGQPQAYYAATPLRLEPTGGTFTAGSVRLAVHLYRMTPPRA